MKKWLVIGLFLLAIIIGPPSSAIQADDGFLQGTQRLACEALLCLSTGSPPTECAPALNRFYSINCEHMWETIRDRKNFLNICPQSNETAAMADLTNAIAAGAGRCDAESLNKLIMVGNGGEFDFMISNVMPNYCQAYVNHEYTRVDEWLPKYVGDPRNGGHWVEAKDYDAAVAEYNARIERENEKRIKGIMGFTGMDYDQAKAFIEKYPDTF